MLLPFFRRTADSMDILKELVAQEGSSDIIPDYLRADFGNSNWNAEETRHKSGSNMC